MGHLNSTANSNSHLRTEYSQECGENLKIPSTTKNVPANTHFVTRENITDRDIVPPPSSGLSHFSLNR